MAVESKAEATWRGDLVGGSGSVRPASGAFDELPLTWRARAEDRAHGTSPEELIAAAHAGCFAMALSNGLAKAGHPAAELRTAAAVSFQAGEGITGIRLTVSGDVPGLDADGFKEAAEQAKANCPVSKALAAVQITLEVQ
jgi:osmotically inducible protein OsmC